MIGKGLSCLGCRTCIFQKDDYNALTSIRCVGKLLIEGPFLSHGYTVKIDATYINSSASSKRVTPRPLRLCRTRDLIRYINNGNLLCIGHEDTQIKIRKLRVKLGAIEHHIKNSGFHTEDFVVKRILQKGKIDQLALKAFIVPKSDDRAALEDGQGNRGLPISSPSPFTIDLARTFLEPET